mgnify:CR=1 FL=1
MPDCCLQLVENFCREAELLKASVTLVSFVSQLSVQNMEHPNIVGFLGVVRLSFASSSRVFHLRLL